MDSDMMNTISSGTGITQGVPADVPTNLLRKGLEKQEEDVQKILASAPAPKANPPHLGQKLDITF